MTSRTSMSRYTRQTRTRGGRRTAAFRPAVRHEIIVAPASFDQLARQLADRLAGPEATIVAVAVHPGRSVVVVTSDDCAVTLLPGVAGLYDVGAVSLDLREN